MVEARAAAGEREVPLERLRLAAPWFADHALWADGATLRAALVGPVRGAEACAAATELWRRAVCDAALVDADITRVSVTATEAGAAVVRWSVEFAAPLPPFARLRDVVPEEDIRPDGLLAVRADVRADLTLDPDTGRIAAYTDAIELGFDVKDTVARYELMSARLLDDAPAPIKWWRVLRYTVDEEARAMDATKTDEQLRGDFASMVARNFGYGVLLGAVIYAGLKSVKLYAQLAASVGS